MKNPAAECSVRRGEIEALFEHMYDCYRRRGAIVMEKELSPHKPVAIGGLTAAELNVELEKGYADVAEGRFRDIDEFITETDGDYRI